MNETQRKLMEMATESIAAAELLRKGGHAGFAASRAYYAMFYVAEALLEGEGKSFAKHSAVISAFGKFLAHPGKVPVELHRYLLEAQDLRESADYGEPGEITAGEAREQIDRAQQFLQVGRRLLDPPAGP